MSHENHMNLPYEPTSSLIDISDKSIAWQKTFKASLYVIDIAFLDPVSIRMFSESISEIKASSEYQFRAGYIIAGMVDAAGQSWKINPNEFLDVFAAVYMAFLMKIIGLSEEQASHLGEKIACDYPPLHGTASYQYMMDGGSSYFDWTNKDGKGPGPHCIYMACQEAEEIFKSNTINPVQPKEDPELTREQRSFLNRLIEETKDIQF